MHRIQRLSFSFVAALVGVLLGGCGKSETSNSDAASTQASLSAPGGKSLEERIAAVVQPLVDDGWTKGLIVGVVQNGKPSYFPFGALGDGSGSRPDKDSVFEIGSVTKVFTALVLADMATKGEVSLDDPIAKHAPADWKISSSVGKPITLASLAAHTSGLPVVPGNFWKQGDKIYDSNVGGQRWREFSVEQFGQYFADPAPPIGSGGKYAYSNLGAGLLGHLLERVGERRIDDLIEERICVPLGMTDTSFILDPSGPGHDVDGEPADFWPIGDSALGGAFALRSTCSDLLKFAAATLDPAGSPMKETLELARQPRGDINELEKTALGWKVNKFGVVYTTGATGGFRSAMLLHPKTRTAVALLANTQVGGVTGGRAALFDALGGSLLNVVLAAPPIDVSFPSPVSIEVGKLADYPGYYSPENGAREPSFPIRVEDGKLITVGPGGVDARLWPAAEDVFFIRAYVAELKFLRDDSGKVIGADLAIEGKQARLKRQDKKPD